MTNRIILNPNAVPDGALNIGTDASNNPVYAVTEVAGTAILAALINNTSSKQKLTYERTVGSTIGFEEKIGLKVSGSAGIPFVTKGSVEISGEISASQAFQSLEKATVTAWVLPETTVIVHQAVLTEIVFYLSPLSPSVWVWVSKTDIVDTNTFKLDESPITKELAAQIAAAG